jgi:hypothetical protein
MPWGFFMRGAVGWWAWTDADYFSFSGLRWHLVSADSSAALLW